MLAAVAAYYRAGWSRPWFDLLAQAKQRYGFFFSITAAMVAGGIAPEALKIAFFQRGRPNIRNLRELAFTMPYWGLAGFTVDLLYRAQNVWFGSGVAWQTLCAKVLVDQFVYNPVYSAPMVVWAYEWKNRRFPLEGLANMFTWEFYRARIIPALIATWGVWIPLVTLIYALPPLLQTPLFTLALSLWVLMVAYMTSPAQLVTSSLAVPTVL